MSADRASVADELVSLALARWSVGVDETGQGFACPHAPAPSIATALRGGRASLRAQLAAAFHHDTAKAASAEALASALLVLEGQALAGEPTPIYLRVAPTPGGVAIDLGDPAGRAVLVTGHGWRVNDGPPVLFRRTGLTSPLPAPVPGGDLDELRSLVNLPKSSWPLVIAWLVTALLPDRPSPILALRGEQGAAKSTTCRVLVELLDPSPAPLRTAPRAIEDWIVAAAGSHVVCLDNLSGVSGWLSDALCRAVTGDGLVRRRLYTDSDTAVVALRRVVVLNGIDYGSIRGDLADRLLVVEPARIGERDRRDDAEVAATWAAARPRVLGALLDLTVRVLAELPSVHLDRRPRMADYANVLAAVDRVLGTDGLDHYTEQARHVASDVVEADPLAAAVRDLAGAGEWTGAARELLDRLSPAQPNREWPATPEAMVARLRRAAGPLRTVGVVVEQLPRVTRARRWRIAEAEEPPGEPS